jgi:hypothetical protein
MLPSVVASFEPDFGRLLLTWDMEFCLLFSYSKLAHVMPRVIKKIKCIKYVCVGNEFFNNKKIQS